MWFDAESANVLAKAITIAIGTASFDVSICKVLILIRKVYRIG